MFKKIRAIYLVFFKGYSVIRFDEEQSEFVNENMEYGACNDSLGFDFGHNGKWGIGNTPFDAVNNSFKNQVRSST